MAGKLFLGIMISVVLVVPAAADMTTGPLLDTLIVPSYQPDSAKPYAPIVTSSVSLDSGLFYRFVASGTFDAGDDITADAKYSIHPPSNVWLDYVAGYADKGTILLDLMVNGEEFGWGSYNPEHVYTWQGFMDQSGPVTFQINDFYPWNDVGDLSVQIYLVPLPAAVLIGMLGLGAAGLKLRKSV